MRGMGGHMRGLDGKGFTHTHSVALERLSTPTWDSETPCSCMEISGTMVALTPPRQCGLWQEHGIGASRSSSVPCGRVTQPLVAYCQGHSVRVGASLSRFSHGVLV